MKFIVEETEYDVADIVQAAPLEDVRNLRKITKGLIDQDDGTFQGVSPRTFSNLFTGLAERIEKARAELEDPTDEVALSKLAAEVLDDDSFLLHMQALIWLAHRKDAPITFEEAGRTPLNGFRIEGDDEEEDDPDPKVPASDPDGSPEQ